MRKTKMYSSFGAPITPLASKLTEKQREVLRDLLGNLDLTLLYKASVHGYQASAFHEQCDNQGPTLLVAYNRSGYVFGGYTSVDYSQSGQYIIDDQAFLFSFKDGAPLCIRAKSGHYARCDDTGGPNFGRQLYFCYNNHPLVKKVYLYDKEEAFSFSPSTLYKDDTWLTECEVYKVEQRSTLSEPLVIAEKPWRNVVWTAKRREELMEMIRDYKPLIKSVSKVRILMIGPVGAGKSSFFNSINSIFTGHVTNKAMSGSAGTSVTTQFRTYPVKDGRGGKPLPFVLCDTMGLEEQSGAGLDIEDISSILQGHVPDRYKFNPTAPLPVEENALTPVSGCIHSVVYVIDATKISIISDKLEKKLLSIRKNVNSLDIPQIVLMTKVDEACPLVEKDLQSLYVSSYIKSKVQEVSSRLGVPVSCVLPVKNYSQELELELNCDVLLLSALQQMLNFANDYLDEVGSM
ncbi:interferon-induced protein 44-like [Puntigrus tetrazona]|uniref:interferon-induced protein 44-like n=1 Tax=Puntigrus tetrazona TaxID=1606681 RepID=UPI001C8A3469|nr:interferon-induced protein 44-like [Puntigrus tetrazona]